MGQQFYNNEQIEAYVTGDLSVEESRALEQAMEQDPVLKNEVNFQNDVIKGVQGYRKKELKQMLDQVPVSSVNTFWKNAGIAGAGLLTGAAIVAGAWYMSGQGEADTPVGEQEKIAIENQRKSQSGKQESVISKPEPGKAKPSGDKTSVKEEKEVKREMEKSGMDAQKTGDPAASTNKTGTGQASGADNPEPPENEKVAVTVERPEPGNTKGNTEQRVKKDVALPEGDMVKGNDSESSFDVSVRDVDQKEVLYKFENGELVLKGDFEGTPYELLELNADNNRRLYLFYKEQYYILKKDNRKLNNASRVEDKDVIQRLKKIKNRK